MDKLVCDDDYRIMPRREIHMIPHCVLLVCSCPVVVLVFVCIKFTERNPP